MVLMWANVLRSKTLTVLSPSPTQIWLVLWTIRMPSGPEWSLSRVPFALTFCPANPPFCLEARHVEATRPLCFSRPAPFAHDEQDVRCLLSHPAMRHVFRSVSPRSWCGLGRMPTVIIAGRLNEEAHRVDHTGHTGERQ